MSSHTLRLLEDTLPPGGTLAAPLPSRARIVYVVEGQAAIGDEGQGETLTANSAWFGTGRCSADAGSDGARLWRWELVGDPPEDNGVATGEGVTSTPKLSDRVELEPSESFLMRCDRVDFPLGGVAYTHTHAGPGTRCLLDGQLTVTVGGTAETFGPGEPWFERGPDPVYAAASSIELTSFVRAIVLPRSFHGKPSIRYVLLEDDDKPKTQTYTRFVDEFIEL